MKVRKAVYTVLGFLFLGLGAVGTILPILPTVPFLMLAAFCFGKSSEKLNNWFKGTKLYKDNLETFVRGEGMTMKTKLRIVCTVTVIMALGFAMMSKVPVGRVILAVVWVCHLLYFFLGVKTIEPQKAEL
ncbi:MAG: YbaN family protein [Clostridiales bacterium]|nr:YbaN family protein [Clostridiales bacterium]